MSNFIKGDRIWVLAEVLTDQHDAEFVTVGVVTAGGYLTGREFADAKKARMETPRLEVGMWVNIGMAPAEIIAREGDYLWLKRQLGGSMETMHISAISHRRDGPRSMEPVPEPETPPVIVHKHTEIAGQDEPLDREEHPLADSVHDAVQDNSKAEWWPSVDKPRDGHMLTREEFDELFPGAHLIFGRDGWTMPTPKGLWYLPAGLGTKWSYSDEIPY